MNKAEAIIDEASKYFGFDVTVRRRWKELVQARKFTINYMIQNTDLALKAIGTYFRDQDHSTIINARHKHENELSLYGEYRGNWEDFKKHMDNQLVKLRVLQMDTWYAFEVTDDVAMIRAKELYDAGALSDFIQHQLLTV